VDIKEFIQVKGKDFKRHPWELARLKMLEYFIRRYHDPKTIVDIGSGDAFLSSEIAKLNPRASVTAIDTNYTDELINEFRNGKPANLHFIKDISLMNKAASIDIIILMDVLEHIENPELLLQQLISLPAVSSRTMFIITVPAYQRLFSRHDKDLGHFKRYNLPELNKLLKPLSFKMNRSGYCFNSLVLIRSLQLLKEKISGHKKKSFDGIHNWKGTKRLTSFITLLFWIEFKISWYLARIGIKVPGLTCYSICQLCPL
jgi:SAM-dependent methyltransferase